MDLMSYLYVFITGGIICTIGQILLDKTKLGSGRILVGFVVLGVFLSGVGIYEHIVNFGGSGATVTLIGFGHLLSEGVKSEVREVGLYGSLYGGLKAAAPGVSAVMLFSLIASLVFDSKPKQ
ncbi:MAG: SpoVA/SpoVAEb family sporulation membrane protein [Lachnospirales bacterium]